MAKYRIPDADEKMECPYDRSHMIDAKRFPYHLIRCRYNHRGSDFASCPFNARHEMPRSQLRYHLDVCPDRATIEQDLAHAAKREAGANIDCGCIDLPAYEDINIPQSESWDNEVSSNPRIGVDPSHFARLKFLKLPGSEWFSQQHEEEMAEEDIFLRRPVSIPSNCSQANSKSAAATVPATALNYSVGIGRGCRGQMNDEASTASQSDESNRSTNESNASEDAKNKKTKRIQKKIRQIQNLEQKQREGYTLTTEEVKKLTMKDCLSAELANLRM